MWPQLGQSSYAKCCTPSYLKTLKVLEHFIHAGTGIGWGLAGGGVILKFSRQEEDMIVTSPRSTARRARCTLRIVCVCVNRLFLQKVVNI